ncbi:MAG: aminodeoxychorismate lyase [Alphaproteobacteria bacterium GM7ARS4]|nr:aminodeoxychorismate lyase [Alphaproteobacteria bacterium GM7ARS4]
MTANVLVNGGQSVDESLLWDRGLAYGDGVFETAVAYKGRIAFFERHWQRFLSGCERLALPLLARSCLEEDIARLLVGRDGERHIIKWMYTRGSGGRGYKPPPLVTPRRIVMVTPYDSGYYRGLAEAGVHVRYGHGCLARHARLAGIKHMSRLEQVLARQEWCDESIYDSLLFDGEGMLVEAVMCNVFLRWCGTWYTPLLHHCGVKGVMRDVAIALARDMGVVVRQEESMRGRVEESEEMFLTNAVIGIVPVVRCGDKALSIGETTRLLQGALAQEFS